MSARKSKDQAEEPNSESTDETPQGRPPEIFVPREKKPPEGMYPEDAKLFSYKSSVTGETYWLPTVFEKPTAVQVWELFDKPMHVQSWSWMKWAAVPRVMQRKIVGLMDVSPDEYLELFDGWFKAVGGATTGE